MSKILPDPRNSRWLLWLIGYAMILTLLLWLNRFIVLGQPFEGVIAFRFTLLALALSFVVNGFGWLDMRLLWLLTTLGIGLGIILMFMSLLNDATGFQDLASLLMFMVYTIVGFASGLLAEGIRFLLKLKQKS